MGAMWQQHQCARHKKQTKDSRIRSCARDGWFGGMGGGRWGGVGGGEEGMEGGRRREEEEKGGNSGGGAGSPDFCKEAVTTMRWPFVHLTVQTAVKRLFT